MLKMIKILSKTNLTRFIYFIENSLARIRVERDKNVITENFIDFYERIL